MDPSQQLNITGLHFASRRLAFFFFFFFFRRSIHAHVPLCAHPARRQWRRRWREAQIPMMHLASLFCHVGAARVFVWLPRPSRLVASEARSRSLRLPLLQTSLAALSFLANSHRVPPFIFFHPAPVSPNNSAGH